jgi:RNA polymerase sigma-70 factor (ECF subfamily)
VILFVSIKVTAFCPAQKSITHSTMNHINDIETLVDGCIAGESQAQRMLFKKYFGYSKSICLRYTSFTEDAEEVLNEGFLKVFNNLKSYDPTYPFKAWLRTIMINTAISYNRKYKKHNRDRIDLDDAQYLCLDDDIVGDITADEILNMISQLKPLYRDVFLMYAVDGYNHREIAEMLDINEATVRSQYARARMQLKAMVSAEYPFLENDWAIAS